MVANTPPDARVAWCTGRRTRRSSPRARSARRASRVMSGTAAAIAVSVARPARTTWAPASRAATIGSWPIIATMWVQLSSVVGVELAQRWQRVDPARVEELLQVGGVLLAVDPRDPQVAGPPPPGSRRRSRRPSRRRRRCRSCRRSPTMSGMPAPAAALQQVPQVARHRRRGRLGRRRSRGSRGRSPWSRRRRRSRRRPARCPRVDGLLVGIRRRACRSATRMRTVSVMSTLLSGGDGR